MDNIYENFITKHLFINSTQHIFSHRPYFSICVKAVTNTLFQNLCVLLKAGKPVANVLVIFTKYHPRSLTYIKYFITFSYVRVFCVM